MGRPDPLTRPGLRLGTVGLLAAVLLTGCATGDGGQLVDPIAPPTSSTTTEPALSTPVERTEPGPAREGARAPSQVDRFAPAALILPGRSQAAVVPVGTADGELQVPEDVDRLGWWDGSSFLGDPFGATVIAGHVDSATEGVGFFGQLLRIRVGDRVAVVGAKGQRQTYEVSSVRTVAKNALATDGRALDQTGNHRLVLITCTGSYAPGRGYASNLVVTAKQVSGATEK